MNAPRIVRSLVLAALLAATIAGAAGAHTATPGNLSILYKGDDAYRNYDFLSQSVSSANVDWAIDFLFTNNASVGKVKAGIGYCCWGSTMYGRFNGGSETGYAYVWDGDGGVKDAWCSLYSDVYHLRVYADGDDRLYNTSWGYWVFGSAHIDHAECGDAYSGMSEVAENTIRSRAAAAWGSYRVFKNSMWLGNYEYLRRDGRDYWWNNGYATRVIVP
jgi:hypothetical protein